MGTALEKYTYAETKYANPHAPTGIWNGATSTLVYDANGNVTQYGTTTAYNWHWRNRMSAAGVVGATSTYAYDHMEQRMRQTLSNDAHTDYPSKFPAGLSTERIDTAGAGSPLNTSSGTPPLTRRW